MDSFKLNIGIKMPDIYYLKIIRRNRVMKMFKKGISVLTALVLVFAMFAGTAYAADYRFATELVNENFENVKNWGADGKISITNNNTKFEYNVSDKGKVEVDVDESGDKKNTSMKFTPLKSWSEYMLYVYRPNADSGVDWQSGTGSQVLNFKFKYVAGTSCDEIGRFDLTAKIDYEDSNGEMKNGDYKYYTTNTDGKQVSNSHFVRFKKYSVEAFGETFTSSNTEDWFTIFPNVWHTVTLILNGDNTYSLKVSNGSKTMVLAKDKKMSKITVDGTTEVNFRGIRQLRFAHQGGNNIGKTPYDGEKLYIDDVQLYKSEAKNYVINNVKAAGTVVPTFADANGKTITAVNIDKYNYSADNTVIAALYDSEGNMKDVCTAENTLDQFSNGDVQLTGGLEIPSDADGYVKVMIFDNMNSLTPLCTAYTLE